MKNKKKYDKIVITNLPAFYKINLFNEISKYLKLLVIFTGDDAAIRNKDFFTGNILFDSKTLTKGNGFKKTSDLIKIFNEIQYNECIIGSWDSLPMWTAAFLSPVLKNALILESSEFESTTKGAKGFLKSIFIKRISKIYAPGIAQKNLAKVLGFKGEIVITKGVGIFNIIHQPAYIKKEVVTNFIYVGRLSPEKNLTQVVETFKYFPYLTLNIIGFGPLEKELKEVAPSNVFFAGSVNNKGLYEVYQKNDVLILASISETWGLVVEEALNNGIPVIVSNKVGCSSEIIKNDINGLVFNIDVDDGLKNAITKMIQIDYYNGLRFNISQLNFLDIANEQVKCYL